MCASMCEIDILLASAQLVIVITMLYYLKMDQYLKWINWRASQLIDEILVVYTMKFININ